MLAITPTNDKRLHVDSLPEVVEAKAECAAVEARRKELQAESDKLARMLHMIKRDTAIQERPDDAYSRIMQRQELTAYAVQKAEVSARFTEVCRDLRALEYFQKRAERKVDLARQYCTPDRVKQADFVQAFQRIAAAAEQLEQANNAMRRLVSDVGSIEGHGALANCTYSGVTIGLGDVPTWRAGAEALCGVRLSVSESERPNHG